MLKCQFCDVELVNDISTREHFCGKRHQKAVPHQLTIKGFNATTDIGSIRKFLEEFGTLHTFHTFVNESHELIVQCRFVKLGDIHTKLVHNPDQLKFNDDPLTVTWTRAETVGPAVRSRSDIVKALSPSSDLETQMNQLCSVLQTNSTEYHEKVRLVLYELNCLLHTQYRKCELYEFGSAVTGLSTISSDLDIFMTGSNIWFDPVTGRPHDQYVAEGTRLKRICRMLRMSNQYRNVFVVHANVPIVSFVHSRTDLKCDLNVKSAMGVQNSKLIAYYLTLDERLRTIMCTLKFWAGYHYNETGTRCELFPGLTTYALCWLFIVYLQQPPYNLPSVQKLQENCRINYNQGWNCGFRMDFPCDLDALRNATVPELFWGFFRYYAQVNFTQCVISPFLGRIFKRATKVGLNLDGFIEANQNALFLMQDPFWHTCNVTRNVKLSALRQFSTACNLIRCDTNTLTAFTQLLDHMTDNLLDNFYVLVDEDVSEPYQDLILITEQLLEHVLLARFKKILKCNKLWFEVVTTNDVLEKRGVYEESGATALKVEIDKTRQMTGRGRMSAKFIVNCQQLGAVVNFRLTWGSMGLAQSAKVKKYIFNCMDFIVNFLNRNGSELIRVQRKENADNIAQAVTKAEYRKNFYKIGFETPSERKSKSTDVDGPDAKQAKSEEKICTNPMESTEQNLVVTKVEIKQEIEEDEIIQQVAPKETEVKQDKINTTEELIKSLKMSNKYPIVMLENIELTPEMLMRNNVRPINCSGSSNSSRSTCNVKVKDIKSGLDVSTKENNQPEMHLKSEIFTMKNAINNLNRPEFKPNLYNIQMVLTALQSGLALANPDLATNLNKYLAKQDIATLFGSDSGRKDIEAVKNCTNKIESIENKIKPSENYTNQEDRQKSSNAKGRIHENTENSNCKLSKETNNKNVGRGKEIEENNTKNTEENRKMAQETINTSSNSKNCDNQNGKTKQITSEANILGMKNDSDGCKILENHQEVILNNTAIDKHLTKSNYKKKIVLNMISDSSKDLQQKFNSNLKKAKKDNINEKSFKLEDKVQIISNTLLLTDKELEGTNQTNTKSDPDNKKCDEDPKEIGENNTDKDSRLDSTTYQMKSVESTQILFEENDTNKIPQTDKSQEKENNNNDNDDDVPEDFFDDFSNQDFMAGLDVVDDWAATTEDDSSNTIPNNTNDNNIKTTKGDKRKPAKDEKAFVPRKKFSTERKLVLGERRDPAKTRRDIARDKIRCAKDREQKIVTKIVESGLVPPGTELDGSRTTGISTDTRRSRENMRKSNSRSSKDDKQQRSRSRRSRSRSPIRKRSLPRRQNDDLRNYLRRRKSSPLPVAPPPKKRTFLEEIEDKLMLNEAQKSSGHFAPLPPHNLAAVYPVSAPPPPQSYMPTTFPQMADYDERYFIGDNFQPVMSANIDKSFGHLQQVPTGMICNENQHTFPTFSQALSAEETAVKPLQPSSEEKSITNQNIDLFKKVGNVSELFAEKRISLSDFLSITAKNDGSTCNPNKIQNKVKVLTRCQHALKLLSDERKLPIRLRVVTKKPTANSTAPSTVVGAVGVAKTQSPLRRIPVVRFQFTTPMKMAADGTVDPLHFALEKIVKKIHHTNNNTINNNNSTSNINNKESIRKQQPQLPIVTEPKPIHCEECRKRALKVTTTQDMGIQCSPAGKLTYSVAIQVCENDLQPQMPSRIKPEASLAALTPAQLLGLANRDTHNQKPPLMNNCDGITIPNFRHRTDRYLDGIPNINRSLQQEDVYYHHYQEQQRQQQEQHLIFYQNLNSHINFYQRHWM